MRFRSVANLDEGILEGKKWSQRTNKVISLLKGSGVYIYFYSGKEISGQQADNIWKKELYLES